MILEDSSPRSRNGCVLLRVSLLDLSMAVFSVSIPGLSRVSLCVFISSSYKDIHHNGVGPTLTALFCLHYLFKGPISRYSHILRYWE